LEANFTAHAQAAGTHDVWFELSGDDADYYSRPDHVFMNFRLGTFSCHYDPIHFPYFF
jgi:hypothetical protein